ncbi:hypothetical protein GCM10011507_30860 [Edaphobacter acidisoli]|uniref:DUF2946 domain-containing protein n=1 Tax=Edaphobacter acidisoli TaxID=2040573 RepID=A0A916W939_9BACT|nr:hypothetical protein [Edaphobacter acidisoli]GGA77420.1 hypothetical protein GCM10011507_30860 [Edaphobacter acidisoli]
MHTSKIILVRRLLAFALLLFFNVPLITPLFALTSTSDANLPACCRRNGKHHCNMQMAEPASNDPSVSSTPEKCPCYPRPATLVRITHAQAQSEAHSVTASVAVTHITPHAETRSKAAFISPYQKRGPPAQQA